MSTTKPPEVPVITSTLTEGVAYPAEHPSFSAPLELYIDCVSVKGDGFSQQLEELVAKKAAEVCAEEKVADIRLVNYGKGPGLLAAKFRADPPKGKVFASSGPLSSPVIEVLVPLAAVVVRGVR